MLVLRSKIKVILNTCSFKNKDMMLIRYVDCVTILLFDLIKTEVTNETMKVMVKAMVTAIVMAIVTAIVIVAVRERIEGLHLC